jgi:amino acid permease
MEKSSKWMTSSRELGCPIGPFLVARLLTFQRRAYIGFPVFFCFAALWKWKKRERTVSYAEMDLVTGKEEIDEEEREFLSDKQSRGPPSRWKQIWDAL